MVFHVLYLFVLSEFVFLFLFFFFFIAGSYCLRFRECSAVWPYKCCATCGWKGSAPGEVFQNRTLLMERSLILISSLNIETSGSPYPAAYVTKRFNMSDLRVTWCLEGERMAQETNQTQVPLLCTTGCGFYGSPRTNGMCSICYKEFLQRQQSSDRISPSASGPNSSPMAADSIAGQHAEGDSTPEDVKASAQTPVTHQMTAMSISREENSSETEGFIKTEEGTSASSSSGTLLETSQNTAESKTSSEKPKQKKNRCFTCRKKIGLTGFDCRCGNLFCAIHRYSDMHACPYDYKAEAAEKIRKENPVVVAEKIQKL